MDKKRYFPVPYKEGDCLGLLKEFNRRCYTNTKYNGFLNYKKDHLSETKENKNLCDKCTKI
jgi:hypothetical protein